MLIESGESSQDIKTNLGGSGDAGEGNSDADRYRLHRASSAGRVFYEAGEWPNWDKVNNPNNFKFSLAYQKPFSKINDNADKEIVTDVKSKLTDSVKRNLEGLVDGCVGSPVDDLLKLRQNLKEYKRELESNVKHTYMTKVDLSEEKESLEELEVLLAEMDSALDKEGYKDINGEWLYVIDPANLKKLTKDYQTSNLKNFDSELKELKGKEIATKGVPASEDFELYDTEEMEYGRIVNQCDILYNRLDVLKNNIIGDLTELPTISDKPGLIWKVEALYNSVRMMDHRHCKDVEQRLKFFEVDYKTIFQTKKPVTITAEDKTEFNKMKEKCGFLTENSDLLEDVLARIDKENSAYEKLAKLCAELRLAKNNQENCMAIAADNKSTLDTLSSSIKENVAVLGKNLDHLNTRLDSLK